MLFIYLIKVKYNIPWFAYHDRLSLDCRPPMLVMHFCHYHSSGYNDSPTIHKATIHKAVIRSFVLKMEKQFFCFGLNTGSTYFSPVCYRTVPWESPYELFVVWISIYLEIYFFFLHYFWFLELETSGRGRVWQTRVSAISPSLHD